LTLDSQTMGLEIIGAESLGVRSLCCLVTLPDQHIVIDPGVSLGYVRNGLLPHPYQVAVGRRVRERILEALGNATDAIRQPRGRHVGACRRRSHTPGWERS